MKFLLYKFSQSPIVTFVTVVCTVFILFFVGLNLNIIASIILSLLLFCVIFVPMVSVLYPFIFIGYSIASIFIVRGNSHICSVILVTILALNVARFGYMFVFAIKNPQLSRDYDAYLRMK